MSKLQQSILAGIAHSPQCHTLRNDYVQWKNPGTKDFETHENAINDLVNAINGTSPWGSGYALLIMRAISSIFYIHIIIYGPSSRRYVPGYGNMSLVENDDKDTKKNNAIWVQDDGSGPGLGPDSLLNRQLTNEDTVLAKLRLMSDAEYESKSHYWW